MPMPEWLRLRRAEPVPADQAAQWTKCPKCGSMIYRPDLAANAWVCPNCSHHFRMHAFDRISMLVDADFVEIGGELLPGDPLGWTDKVPYPQKLQRDREKSKLTEGVVCGFASIGGTPVALGVMDFNFRGGTMGTVVGERIAQLFESRARTASPVHRLYRQRRRAHGRGDARADADGEDDARRAALPRRRRLLRERADRPDDGRRLRIVRLPGRRHLGRGAGCDRLRRAGASSSRRSARSCPRTSRRRSSCSRRARSTWSSSAASSRTS